MEIKQEEFNKLSQLDRIEFRQKIDRSVRGIFGIFGLGIIATLIGQVFYSFIFLVIGFYFLGKSFKTSKEIVEEYFNVQVKRNERGAKK